MVTEMPSPASYLVCYFVLEGEFEKIITKTRLSIKDNNN